MKKRVLVILLMLAMTTGMLAGCGKKEVDYGLEESTEGNVTLNLAEFKKIGTWTDEWSIKTERGYEKPVIVDAEVVMPDVENFSVVEVEQQPFDTAFRKQFLMAYYENGEIYDHDMPQYTKGELEELIANLEEHMDGVDAVTQEEWKKTIEEYEKQLETAPEEYVQADDYESSDSYVGYLGEIACSVNFQEKWVFAGPSESNKDYWPEELREYERARQLSAEEMEDMEGMENECKLSMTEARRLADSFLLKIGSGSRMCMEARDVMWQGENTDGGLEAYKRTLYGYSFTYGIGIDNLVFAQFPDYTWFGIEWPADFDCDYSNGDKITIVVTDNGITEVTMYAPVNIRKVSEPIDIVSADTVKGIIKAEMTENAQKYDFPAAKIEFNRLELIYMKIRDESQEGVYSYVPAWCISLYNYEFYNTPIFVNAIDGSIIYMGNAAAEEDTGESDDLTVEDMEEM